MKYITAEALRDLIKTAIEKAGSNVKYAKQHGLPIPQVWRVVSNKQKISDKVARTVGYTRKVVYSPVED